MNILKYFKSESKKEKAYDPVCGMGVTVENSKYKIKYEDKVYYFCSESCKEQFNNDPENFI